MASAATTIQSDDEGPTLQGKANTGADRFEPAAVVWRDLVEIGVSEVLGEVNLTWPLRNERLNREDEDDAMLDESHTSRRNPRNTPQIREVESTQRPAGTNLAGGFGRLYRQSSHTEL